MRAPTPHGLPRSLRLLDFTSNSEPFPVNYMKTFFFVYFVFIFFLDISLFVSSKPNQAGYALRGDLKIKVKLKLRSMSTA